MPKKIVGTCPYCLRESLPLNTKEHVIPRKWFEHKSFPYQKPLIISCCNTCNNLKAKEDEWMRMWLTTAAAGKSLAAKQILMGKVRRSVENGTFRKSFQEQYLKMELTDRLPSGIYLPKPMTKIEIPDADGERITSYVTQVVKGLYNQKYGTVLPSSHGLQTFYACDQMFDVKPSFMPMFSHINKNDWVLENSPVFIYGMSKTSDSDHWICVTAFYDTIAFLTFIGPNDWLQEKKELPGEK